jgi:hypothetical protein
VSDGSCVCPGPESSQKLRSTGGTGHIVIFNTLAIGHTMQPNEQRISSHPLAVKKIRGSNRQDFVFILPPGISQGAYELRMDNALVLQSSSPVRGGVENRPLQEKVPMCVRFSYGRIHWTSATRYST